MPEPDLDDVLADVGGAKEAYDEMLPIAKEIAKSSIVLVRADTKVLFRNVVRAAQAMAAVRPALVAALPRHDWARVDRAPKVALALHHAATLVDHSSPGTIAELMKRAYEIRGVLLPLAKGYARKGLLPAKEFERIAKGVGRIDVASDCVDVAALFTTNLAAFGERPPLSKEDLDEASSVGTRLLALLKPDASKSDKPAALIAALENRDRLYTLLRQDYTELRRAAMYEWADDVNDHVPPLHSFFAEPAPRPPVSPVIPTE